MKKSEAGLFVIFILMTFILLAFFATVPLRYHSFSDPIIKKYLLLIFFSLALSGAALFLNSFSKVFLLAFPILFQLNRVLINLSDFMTLPRVLQSAGVGIDIIETIIILLFFVFFNVKKILYYFEFRAIRNYIFFIIIGLISTLWAFSSSGALCFIPNIIVLPCSYYVFSRFFEIDERNILYIIIGITLTGLFTTVFVWPEYFGIKWFSSFVASDNPVKQTDAIRAGGLISRAGIAILLASIIPFIYNFGIFYYSKYKVLVNVIGLILLLTLVMTLNRMHFFATCCSLVLIIFYAIKEKVMKINLSYFFTGVIVFGAGLYYIISKNTATVADIVYRTTYEGRLRQYEAAFENIKYSYGLGIGMNNFLVSPITLTSLGANSWNLTTGNTVHDDIIRISCEYGILGLLFFILSFLFLFMTPAKQKQAKAIVRGGKINIIVLLMIGLSAPAFNNDTVLTVCGLYMAIIRYYSTAKESKLLNELNEKYSKKFTLKT